ILIRQALERTLKNSGSGSPPARPAAVPGSQPSPAAAGATQAPPGIPSAAAPPSPEPPVQPEQEEHLDSLQRCVNDICAQLAAIPPKSTPGVSTISLGGCKLLIATWEAEAFRTVAEPGSPVRTLQRAVAARTILHVCMERQKRHEETDLAAALEIAGRLVE